MRDNKYGIILAICIAIIILCITYGVGISESSQRALKSYQSEFGGGLNRTVTVYDYNGDEIKSYTGKFDVSESENEVYFDLNDKRVIIHGGIVINEEN